MKRLASWLLVALLALAPLSARAGIANAVTLGFHNQAAATTNVLTTATNDCPVGSLAYILTGYTTIADTLSSVTDNSTGGPNSWVVIENKTTTGIGLGVAYAVVTHDIAVGNTITGTFAGSVTSEIYGTCVPSGVVTVSPLDISNKSQNGLAAAAAASVSTGTLAQPVEILMGTLATAADSGITTAGGSWTNLGRSTSTPGLMTSFQIVSVTTTVAWAPTWVTNNNYVTDISTFKGIMLVPGAGLMGIGQ